MCLFCKIIKKEIPATIVHETDHVLAFRDINPQAPEHILVIPKQHIGSLMEITPNHKDSLSELISTIQHIAKTLNFDQNGFRVVTNIGLDGGQTVEHLHYHILAGRQLKWPPG